MEKAKNSFMRLIFNIYNICMVLPLGLAVLFAIVYLDGGWADLMEGHDLEFYMLPELKHKYMAAIILIGICLVCVWMIRKITRINAWFHNQNIACLVSGAGVFVIAAVVRLLLMYLFQEDIQPFSDFRRVWDMAHGEMEGNLEYYSLFPAYLNFTVFLRKLVSVFGDVYMHAIYLNAVLAAITASLICFIARMVTNSEKTSLIAGLLYAFMPSNIVYCATGTPEFLAVACQVLGVLFLVRSMDEKLSKRAVWILAGGAFTGVGSSYKSFGIIIVIAFIMAYAAKRIFIPEERRRYQSFPGESKKGYFMLVLYAILAFSGYHLAENAVVHYTEEVLEVSISRQAPYPHYFLIGLNTQGEGQIHNGTISRAYYMTYLSNGLDADAAGKYALELLKTDWRRNGKAVLPNFIKKMIWAWQDDNMPLFYFNTFVGLSPDTQLEWYVYRFMRSYMCSVEQFYYMCLMLASMIGCLVSGRKKERCFEKEFLMLIIFGYFCLMILSEAQSRYKCLIMPYICLAAAIGIKDFIHVFEKVLGNR